MHPNTASQRFSVGSCFKNPVLVVRATWEERSCCYMVKNSEGKHHLMLVVCIKSCSRLKDKTASERSQGLLFLQSFGMLVAP
jgi:hypothetical protein